MMLVQSSIDDHGKQESSCIWIPGDESWQEPTNIVPLIEHKKKDDSLWSRNLVSCSQLSTEVNMFETSKPNFVYKRRTIQRNANANVCDILPRSTPTTLVYKRRKIQSDNSKSESVEDEFIGNPKSIMKPTNIVPLIEHKKKDDSLWSRNLVSCSQLSTEVNMFETSKPNFVYKRRTIQRNANANVCDILPRSTPTTLVYKRRKIQSDNSKSGSVEDEFIGNPKSIMKKCSGLHAVNDSCSSSKSNIDLGSVFMKHQVDDVGECSSSGVVIMEGLNSCFSFLKQHGVLERIKTKNKQTSVKKNIYCLKACKVCDRSTSTLNMLICDLCEESFHVSCCNSVIRKVPVGDWFCNFCSRKQLKKIKETNSRKLPKDCLGPIASMLRDVDPYTSNVRIGEDFQVEIPDWSGPLTDELNDYIKHIEINRLDCASYQDWDSSKLSRLSSIGNWLQCREEVDNDGTICGKWRRAPLLEVQTDSWECFSSVLWDPTHADCAVPQELDTDQVLKQLKYIEMLRPRFSAKR